MTLMQKYYCLHSESVTVDAMLSRSLCSIAALSAVQKLNIAQTTIIGIKGIQVVVPIAKYAYGRQQVLDQVALSL